MGFLERILTDPYYLGKFTLLENVFLLIGVVFWAYVYFALIVDSNRKQFVEMPVFIACGNIVWEFLWGFVIQEDMGIVLNWGYKLAFLLDVVIFYNVFRYGQKQFKISISTLEYRILLLVLLLSWGALIYTYYVNRYDLFTGSNSAYILNLFISAMYPVLFLSMNDNRLFSYPIAWCKFLGTVFFTVFLFLYFPKEYFVLCLGILVFIADAYYVYLFAKTRK
ncbi:hypothetical protein RBB68_12640 [Leptospira interrogans]|uniref:Uncharacterized protein n=10 Tax=Leptospira interrogans TaxID=173 RepID=A0AAP9WB14_LEPIR|nr:MULTISPECIES: hypothetical protein [Leptospira]EMF71727.1 putative membrane protein [Leptospira interrogans serovar Canicola str. LT1962]EMG09807.1 putative membrane protein [Leptospira interrogans serovar Grippotyphosa str. LT2186]EMM83793.1 putative membrane protein [Leptospira interrogans str. 2006001854]EMM97330.1 putative membrane protein [Leptospira interrogans serovar Zanoni str. LT2156]EMN29194.1 putative membrane protein [Leptospira interrogans serovar Pyrogenes str. L0374]EMN7158